MARRRSKYSNARTDYNGRTYDSKAEARYAMGLDMRQRAGEVLYWLWQVPFHLPGKTVYRCDFAVFESDGSAHYVDVKGIETQLFKLKKRQVEELYPVTIEVVKTRGRR